MHLPAPDFVLISRHVNVRGRAQPQGERLSRRPHFMKEARARSVCLMTSSPRLGSPAEDVVDSIGCRLLLWEGLLQSHFSLASPPLMYTSLIPWVIFLSIHGSPKTTLCYCSETVLLRGFQCLDMWCLCTSILLNRVLSFPWVVKWRGRGIETNRLPKVFNFIRCINDSIKDAACYFLFSAIGLLKDFFVTNGGWYR